MIATTLADSARKSVSAARAFALGQIDGQVKAFAEKLRATSGSLNGVSASLRTDPIVASVAPLVDQAEAAVGRFATYLDERGVDRIAIDLEAFSRANPIAATLAATLVGFTISRAVKASSVRRFESSDSATPTNGVK
ncbi:MAG: hypothetical protein IAI49_02565 [Candidatus Eremiobacteraeota bacterium]|nr:hypothetical protein [Candidatus Eremiobacteraeota bacterium]